MVSKTTTKKTGPMKSLSTGSSFDRETQSTLRVRLLLLFTVGLLVSIAAYLTDLFITERRDAILNGFFSPWYDELFLSLPISFALGIIVILLANHSRHRLCWIAFLVMTYNIIVVLFGYAVYLPQYAPLFPLALILFVHAAFLPVPVRFQVGLVLIALFVYPFGQLLAISLCPMIRNFWANYGGYYALQTTLVTIIVNIIILGVVTTLVNKTLYNMRRKLHKAKRLGNYQLGDLLGEGGMGKVYVGEHTMMCRPTAVKILDANQDNQPTALARFEREVRLASMLTHPNTITIYDYGRTSDNTFYYAMEFLEGMDLQRLVKKFGPLPIERVIFILLQICSSLAEAHARNVIHRDIKPSNIFLTRRGGLYDFVKVLDFGLAKEIKADVSSVITKTGAFFGTPRYIAPESIYGNVPIDARADLYNLGAVAYWMLTGQPIFASSSSVELLVDQVKTIPPKPSEICELDIPAEIDAIAMKCLEKKPEDRYQSASELTAALQAVPLESIWDNCKARDWWGLHLNLEDQIHICPETGNVIYPPLRAPGKIQQPKELSRQDFAGLL